MTEEYIKIDFDELPKSDINHIVDMAYNDSHILNGWADVLYSIYDDEMYNVDYNENKTQLLFDIPVQESSQGPYVSGRVKFDVKEYYPQCEVTIYGTPIDVILKDIETSGYSVDIEDLDFELDYDDRYVPSDLDEDILYNNVMQTSVVKKFASEILKDANEYLDKKWEVIKAYMNGDLYPLESYLEDLSDTNSLKFVYSVDENGNLEDFQYFEY